MSDAEVLAAIERMEGWLQDPGSMPAAEGLADWNAAFQSAVAGAERGAGWAELVARAHALGSRVQERTEALTAVRDQIRNELGAQQLGDRALKGYGASAR